MRSGRAPPACGIVTMSKSPPCTPDPRTTVCVSKTLFAWLGSGWPLFSDFMAIGPPIAPLKMQLCESTQELGSALPADPSTDLFDSKVAGPGDAGGAYAPGPPVCLMNQVLVRQVAAGQLLTESA